VRKGYRRRNITYAVKYHQFPDAIGNNDENTTVSFVNDD